MITFNIYIYIYIHGEQYLFGGLNFCWGSNPLNGSRKKSSFLSFDPVDIQEQ